MASRATSPPLPSRGEIWSVEFSPTRGREQSGHRPALVLSNNAYNEGPATLVVVAPLTTRDRRIPLWVAVDPPNGGVTKRSFVMTDAIRSVSKERFDELLGMVDARTMRGVEDRLRVLLDL